MITLSEIADTFEMLGDWDQRYQYLIELGESLPAMAEDLKTDANKVHECMSQVWVLPYVSATEPNEVHFHGDCDTSIIKGVLALLIQLVDGKSSGAIQQLDVDEIFEKLKLGEHLSPNRHVGIYAIVKLMKKQASQLNCSDILQSCNKRVISKNQIKRVNGILSLI